jgi:chromosomal replication initiator protein
MNAIGHEMKRLDRNLRLTYVTTEKFTNELINAIRYDKLLSFRERYRNNDVLLMDDIQFIAGKEATQNEFFHTFNALYDNRKQIVISADNPPHEIPTVQERLQSRFKWGLIADILPPDLETKVAILTKKAAQQRVNLPHDVAMYVAMKIRSNIRELEGALVRLLAFGSLRGSEITLPMAQETLRGVLGTEGKTVTIESIQKAVADHYSLRVFDLKAKTNAKSITEPRQICMYLCKKVVGASLPKIGKEFGDKHHTTVLHSIQKIEALRQSDPVLNKLIQSFMKSFQ